MVAVWNSPTTKTAGAVKLIKKINDTIKKEISKLRNLREEYGFNPNTIKREV